VTELVARYRRPADVAVVLGHSGDAAAEPDIVYLSHLPTGSLLVLRGTGALIWNTAVATDGGEGDLVDRLAQAVGLTPSTIREDVLSFIGQLLDRRLLELR
jgi:hypothetical protein